MGLLYALCKDVPLVRSRRPDRTIHFHPVFAASHSHQPIFFTYLIHVIGYKAARPQGVGKGRGWEKEGSKNDGTEIGHTDIPIAIAILIAVPNNDRAALTRFLLLR